MRNYIFFEGKYFITKYLTKLLSIFTPLLSFFKKKYLENKPLSLEMGNMVVIRNIFKNRKHIFIKFTEMYVFNTLLQLHTR